MNTVRDEWQALLAAEFELPYMQALRQFLVVERQAGKTFFPPSELCFNAFNQVPPQDIRVVILGQDPYHGDGQAHGLSFSVPAGVPPPPSLLNMYKELHEDVGFVIPQHGNLQAWAEQGVFLLNSVLTVGRGDAGSHRNQGWERFTDKVIHLINEQCSGVVFLLWGSYAQKKASFVDSQKHLVLKAPHPSPLSAYRGFFGCKHFSQANQYLQQQCKPTVNWQL